MTDFRLTERSNISSARMSAKQPECLFGNIQIWNAERAAYGIKDIKCSVLKRTLTPSCNSSCIVLHIRHSPVSSKNFMDASYRSLICKGVMGNPTICERGCSIEVPAAGPLFLKIITYSTLGSLYISVKRSLYVWITYCSCSID